MTTECEQKLKVENKELSPCPKVEEKTKTYTSQTAEWVFDRIKNNESVMISWNEGDIRDADSVFASINEAFKTRPPKGSHYCLVVNLSLVKHKV